MYRPHTKATIVILLIYIIDKYKENLAGIKNICPMLQLLISEYISLHFFLWILGKFMFIFSNVPYDRAICYFLYYKHFGKFMLTFSNVLYDLAICYFLYYKNR